MGMQTSTQCVQSVLLSNGKIIVHDYCVKAQRETELVGCVDGSRET